MSQRHYEIKSEGEKQSVKAAHFRLETPRKKHLRNIPIDDSFVLMFVIDSCHSSNVTSDFCVKLAQIFNRCECRSIDNNSKDDIA